MNLTKPTHHSFVNKMAFLLNVCMLSILYATVSSTNNLNKLLFNGDYEFIDLTHPYDNNTVYWPGAQKFVFTRKQEEFVGADKSWYASYDFATGEHVGTHVDAPFHFILNGKHIGQIPLEKFIVPLIIVDISSKVNGDSNFVLYKHHLDYILNDNLGQPCLIIFKFGWTEYFYTGKYMGYDRSTNKLNFPSLSSEVAQWIVSSYKNVVGVGVDVASVDPGSSTEFPVHKILLQAGLYHVENANLHRDLPDYGCTALALPMKIAEGTGAPVRLVAICPKQNPTSFDTQ